MGLKVIAVTSKADSPLAECADAVIIIPGRVKDSAAGSIQRPELALRSVHPYRAGRPVPDARGTGKGERCGRGKETYQSGVGKKIQICQS